MSNKQEKLSHIGENDENKDRGNWDRKTDYLLSCIGYAVGLGNVWRFPYLAFRNGGGAFLIPYVVMLVLAGIPTFFVECAMGQFASLGPIAVWKMCPLFKGVGICAVVLTAYVGIYYNIIIAYTVFYFFSSLTSVLPWSDCNNFWNSEMCNTTFTPACNLNLTGYLTPQIDWILNNTNIKPLNGTEFFQTVPDYIAKEIAGILNPTTSFSSNETELLQNLQCPKFDESIRSKGPSEEYWENYCLREAKSIEPSDNGAPSYQLGLTLFLSWIVVFYSLSRGIKSSGKVVYFTAIFPYVILVILLIRGATLDGAYEGVQYYIGQQSDLSRLSDANVWKDAATQIFFSLSVAGGGLVSLSSYNKFKNNVVRDTLIVCICNCLTSLFAGFAIFTIVGNMAKALGKPVDEVVDSGFGLAFVAYPEAMTKLPASSFWSIIFFLMLFTLGLDTQFTILETCATTIIDAFPKFFRPRRWQLTLLIAIVMYFLGLACITETGPYWVNLIDHYAAGWGLIIIAVLEIVGVMWVYGGNRFIEDVEMMVGKRSWLFWLYWRACWFFITPMLLFAILIWSLVTFEPASYGNYKYPEWADAVGWLTLMSGVMFVPIMAVVAVVLSGGNVFKASLPAADWGPYLRKHRGKRYALMDEPSESLGYANQSTAPSSSVKVHKNDAFNEEEDVKL